MQPNDKIPNMIKETDAVDRELEGVHDGNSTRALRAQVDALADVWERIARPWPQDEGAATESEPEGEKEVAADNPETKPEQPGAEPRLPSWRFDLAASLQMLADRSRRLEEQIAGLVGPATAWEDEVLARERLVCSCVEPVRALSPINLCQAYRNGRRQRMTEQPRVGE